MKNIKVLILIVSFSFILLLNSCKDNESYYTPTDDLLFRLSFLFSQNEVDSMIAIGELPSRVDGFQYINKNDGNYYHYEGIVEHNTEEITSAYSYYVINGDLGNAQNVKVEGNTLRNLDVFYKFHDYKWEINSAPQFSSPIHWQFTIGHETVYDTINLPSNFRNISFSSDTLDLDKGITLSWPSSNSKIKINPSYTILDSTKNNILAHIYTRSIQIEDHGSFVFTPELLSNLGVPNDGTVNAFIFNFQRWNLKFKNYDNDRKILVTVGEVECNAVCRVK